MASEVSTPPPTLYELETAWWQWVNEGCPSRSPRTRGRWMRENTFTYAGTTWTRNAQSMESNSGKTTYTLSQTFCGADGRVVHEETGRPLNRRNDPERDYGLPD